MNGKCQTTEDNVEIFGDGCLMVLGKQQHAVMKEYYELCLSEFTQKRKRVKVYCCIAKTGLTNHRRQWPIERQWLRVCSVEYWEILF